MPNGHEIKFPLEEEQSRPMEHVKLNSSFD